jgi:hypothetical protein
MVMPLLLGWNDDRLFLTVSVVAITNYKQIDDDHGDADKVVGEKRHPATATIVTYRNYLFATKSSPFCIILVPTGNNNDIIAFR